jgi:hypothetical protein
MNSQTDKSKLKKAELRAKGDEFLNLEKRGIEQIDSPVLLLYREKQLLKELLIRELQLMSDDNISSLKEDKVLKQSLLSKHYELREQIIEDIYLKIHE